MIECFGITKQAFYKRLKSQRIKENNDQIVIQLIKGYRNEVGQRTGGIKLYKELKTEMNKQGVKLGRDKFYKLLKQYNLLVPKTKRYFITTNSKHQFYKYDNLVKDKAPTRPEQLWVSDITYIKTQRKHCYLALVTDAYSKKIISRAVHIYNNKRIHFSLKLNTPAFVHSNQNVVYRSYKMNKENIELLTF